MQQGLSGWRRRAGSIAFASRVAAATTLAVAAAFAPSPAAAATAGSADDICAAAADPCMVTTRFDVVSGSVLDFGTRSVVVSGSGQFNFGAGSGSILCGNFTASTTGSAIDANDTLPAGGTGSGVVGLLARRLCTGGAAELPCTETAECQLGACGTRRCSARPTRTCTSDAGCDVGPCGLNKRCIGAPGIVRCESNADCNYGTCPQDLTCAKLSTYPRLCTTDGDCDLGACTKGTASIAMGGPIVGNSGSPAQLQLKAADSVSISKSINLSSAAVEADGGDLTVRAVAGSVTVTGKLTLSGGASASGGIVEITAGTDVTIGEEMSVVGGDFDGGSVDIAAGRDVVINRSVLANSISGAGFGGEILVAAGRDLAVNGTSATSKATLEANGHVDAQGTSGDGGTIDLSAARDLTLGANSRLLGRGAAPEGSGSEMFVAAGGNLLMAGDVTARADGIRGAGGILELAAAGTATAAPSSLFDLAGGQDGGGVLSLTSAGNVDFSGLADVSGGSGGVGGSVFFDGNADTSITGTLSVGGSSGGTLDVSACRITLGATGELDNRIAGSTNRLLSRESMKLLAGSSMKSGTGGVNNLVYRSAAKPPVVAGTVTPTQTLILDTTLTGCPVCGNSEVDQGETCDDGNTAGGDGCSAGCQNENCIAQTAAPGYPAVPLCDDAKPCTDDTCNTAQNGGTCRHRAKNCDDQVACTTDSCEAATGNCLNVPVDSACSDSNPCTTDACTTPGGCSSVANNAPCDDGDPCTVDDTCSAMQCHGTPAENCQVCGDGMVTGTEACDDGNATFSPGEDCGVGCVKIPCGRPTNSSGPTPKTSDALYALRTAVGLVSCSLKVCDVDSNARTSASDAQRILRAAVGLPQPLVCPV